MVLSRHSTSHASSSKSNLCECSGLFPLVDFSLPNCFGNLLTSIWSNSSSTIVCLRVIRVGIFLNSELFVSSVKGICCSQYSLLLFRHSTLLEEMESAQTGDNPGEESLLSTSEHGVLSLAWSEINLCILDVLSLSLRGVMKGLNVCGTFCGELWPGCACLLSFLPACKEHDLVNILFKQSTFYLLLLAPQRDHSVPINSIISYVNIF